jgi:hypothetical protein
VDLWTDAQPQPEAQHRGADPGRTPKPDINTTDDDTAAAQAGGGGMSATEGKPPSKIVEFPSPKSETTPEENIRRQMAEAQRLANLAPGEYLLWAPDSAKRLDMPVEQLVAAVKAILEQREKERLEAKAEEQRREERAERERTAVKRKQEREREREQARAEKDTARKREQKEKAFEVMAKLPGKEREIRLADLAKRLDEDVEILRAEFEAFVGTDVRDAEDEDVEPWPEPVDTKALLTEMMAHIRRYVVLHDDDAAVAMVLWICFAWLHDIAVHSPILVLTSADADAGKTTACGVLQYLTPRAYAAAELTGPNLYRFVDQERPTLIVDDADRLFERKPDLVHIVNVGWTRGTKIPRQYRGATRWFSPFCPKVVSGVGLLLPRTTATRTIAVRLLPKLPHEKIDAFQHVDDDDFHTLRRKLARWSADNAATLKDARPVMTALNNRAAMNWKLLLAVAELAGAEWGKRARQAAAKLTRERCDPSVGKRLLAAFYGLFTRHGVMLTSADVQRRLTADEDGEWAEYNGHGRPISKRQIALLLDAYGINPGVIHPDGRKAERGYRVEQFETAFRHFLGKAPPRKRTSVRKARGERRK